MTKSEWLIILVILILTSILYSKAFSNDFVGDDEDFILNWTTTRSIQNLPRLFLGDSPFGHGGVYRPIRSVIYLLSYQAFGTRVLLYHVLALSSHLLSTILAFFLTKKITQKTAAAFLTSLLFSLHPIHSEAIDFITASFDVWSAVFLFSSIILYLKYSEASKVRYYLLSLILAYLAYFSNELTFSLPLLLLATEIVLKGKGWSQLFKSWLVFAPHLVGITLYFTIRIILNIPQRGVVLFNWYYTVLTATKVFWYYLGKMVLPINLNAIPTLWGDITAYDIRPDAIASQRITDLPTIGGILVAVALLWLAIFLRRRDKEVSFSLAWLLLGLSPAMATFATGALVQERYTYIASYGFCLLVGLLLYRLYQYQKWLAATAMILVSISYFAVTFHRAADWQKPLAFWQKTVSNSPRSARAHLGLGLVLLEMKSFDQALSHLQESVAIFPRYAEAYSAIGRIYLQNSQLAQARDNFSQAVRYNPDIPVHHFYLAQAEVALGNLNQAESILEKAVRLHPDSVQLWYNLGATQFLQGKIDKARETLNNALLLDPHYEPARNALREIEKFN